MNILEDIPKDLLPLIIKMLNPRSFCNLRLVNKLLKERCDEKLYQIESLSTVPYSAFHTTKMRMINIIRGVHHGRQETIITEYRSDEIKYITKTSHHFNKGIKEGPVYMWIGIDTKECPFIAKDTNLTFSYHHYNGKLEGLCYTKTYGSIFTTQYKQGVKVDTVIPIYEAESAPLQTCKDENHTNCDRNDT